MFGLAAKRGTVQAGTVGANIAAPCVVAKRSITEVPAISIDNTHASGGQNNSI